VRTSFLALCFLATAIQGCTGCGQKVVCNLSGPINDPSNRSFRRSILSRGLGEFCKEMTSRNAPLKMNEDTPSIGRFYPRRCQQRELENGDLVVTFEGEGYAFTNMSKKVTFTSSGTVHYNQDFRCAEDDSLYAYFPTKQVQSSSFALKLIEQPIANLMQNWIGPYAESFGRQVVSGKLSEGFTVIRDTDGNTDFGLGIIPLGQRPLHPFKVKGSSKVTYENQRAEVHQNQRDFIGPIVIEDSGRALYLTANVSGVPIDVLVSPRNEAEASLRQYLDAGPSGPLAFPPRFQAVAQPGVEYKQMVPLSAGVYYVILDNSPTAGQVAPPVQGLHDAVATVEYVIQIGDTP
jgi:hypothetical protein